MEIKVRIGEVEVEYSEPTESTIYPKCTSIDTVRNKVGSDTKHDLLLKTICAMADKAVELHNSLY